MKRFKPILAEALEAELLDQISVAKRWKRSAAPLTRRLHHVRRLLDDLERRAHLGEEEWWD